MGSLAFFVQTRRVMHGWPKSERDQYHSISDIVVTSNNILHVTILPMWLGNDAETPDSLEGQINWFPQSLDISASSIA